MSFAAPSSATAFALESLEHRQLLSAAPWGIYPKLIRQDVAAQDFPNINGSGESVAVIDSGVDYNHPVLGHGFGTGHKVIAGFDFLQNDSDPNIGQGVEPHGTGVAGVIAADPYTFNGKFYQGVAPKLNIIALREHNASQVKQALDWVIAHRTQYKIVAISMLDFISWGPYHPSYTGELATLAKAGVFIGSPASNGGANAQPSYPDLDPNVYVASGINRVDQIPQSAERNSSVDLLGPSDNVTLPYDSSEKPIFTDYGQGTSWAAAYMVGAAALIKQIDPTFSASQVMKIMRDSGKPIFDSVTHATYPRLDLDAALKLATQQAHPTPPPPPNGGGPISAQRRNFTVNHNQPFQEMIAAFTDAAGAGPTSNYTVTADWGDGSSPSVASVSADPSNPGHYRVYDHHNYVNQGTFNLNIKIIDAAGTVVVHDLVTAR